MNQKLSIEISFWILGFIIALLVLAPIYYFVGWQYQYYVPNLIAIVIFLQFSRYLFLLKYSPLSHAFWVKFSMVFLCIPIFLYLLQSFLEFKGFLDEVGISSIYNDNVANIPTSFLSSYIRTEMIFSLVAAMLVTFLFPFRMVISIWRVRNRSNKV